MGGGLIQLIASGAQDVYLTGNPQISFFKKVQKKYTNFSMQMISKRPIIQKNLENDSDIDIEFKIDRDAELIKDMYLTFDIPDIYSNNTDKFQWIQRLGEYIIKEVSIHGGNSRYDTHYSEWLQIWHELTLISSLKPGYYKMIGHETELNDPETFAGSYPNKTTSSAIPSIRGRRLYVPLLFWFNRAYSQGLPLIAIQYEELKLKVKLRPAKHLFTILDSGHRIRSTGSIGSYIKENPNSLDLNTSLEINYIFLDEIERNKFSNMEHSYLVNQLQRVQTEISPDFGLDKTTSINIENFQHPITNLIWILRRSDLENANQWHNFTNWPVETIPPFIGSNINSYNPFSNEESSTDENDYPNFKHKNICLSGNLTLNGLDRFEVKDVGMFNLVNNYQHQTNVPDEGINVYSFNLNNYIDINLQQPNGSCNMSRFNTKSLNITTVRKPTGTSYNYNVTVFAISYNILRIMGGMANMEFNL